MAEAERQGAPSAAAGDEAGIEARAVQSGESARIGWRTGAECALVEWGAAAAAAAA
jgi:hypothetical protein